MNAGLVTNTPHKRKRLGKNIIWNLAGSLAPLLAAAFTVPYIIEQLGLERFGILTIIWAVIGYFSLFDMGLGQALTRQVAEDLEDKPQEEIATSIWTALLLMLILGVFAGVFLGLISSWLLNDLLQVPDDLKQESLAAFMIMAVSLPVIVTTAGLRGVLEACQQFRSINLIRIPMGIFVFVSPLLVLPFSNSLMSLAVILVVGRLLAWLFFSLCVFRTLPYLQKFILVSQDKIMPLIRFGGWLTISNLLLPLMVYFDRFVIGALLSLAAVAFYVTPHEIVTRIRIIPVALMGVVFPAFSQGLINARQRVVDIFIQSQNAIFLSVLPVALIITAFAEDGLQLWLDDRFVESSLHVVQWLAAGVFVNAVGAIPVSLVRAAGKPDIIAKLHLLELPIFFFILIEMVKLYGINGAAFVYFLRWCIDTLLMLFLAARIVSETRLYCVRSTVLMVLGLMVLIGASLIESNAFKLVYIGSILLGMMILFRRSLILWRAQTV